MLVATFAATSGWVGKTITFENDTFVLQDHGPIKASDVMQYDSQGHLTWASDGTRAWVGSKAQAPAPSLSVAVVEAGLPSTSQPAALTHTQTERVTVTAAQADATVVERCFFATHGRVTRRIARNRLAGYHFNGIVLAFWLAILGCQFLVFERDL